MARSRQQAARSPQAQQHTQRASQLQPYTFGANHSAAINSCRKLRITAVSSSNGGSRQGSATAAAVSEVA